MGEMKSFHFISTATEILSLTKLPKFLRYDDAYPAVGITLVISNHITVFRSTMCLSMKNGRKLAKTFVMSLYFVTFRYISTNPR